MIRTVIYGGSFDPVHKAHEGIIHNLSRRFDEVIVVPTYISPFKMGESVAPASLRLEMIRSLDLPSNVVVSDFEIERGGTSYSIDTALHFASPKRKLYFAIGSEGSRSVGKWKRSEELRALCEFYVIRRPGYDDGKTEFTLADFWGEDVSSSEVKAALAFGKADGLISGSVKSIIQRHGLYTDYFRYTAAFPAFNLKPERIEHTYRATLEGIKLAKRYDVSVKDSIIALILHDIGKYVTPKMLTELNIPVPVCDLPEPCVHAEYGAAIARHYFALDDEIVEAIRTHTTCGANMTRLGEIVALADYIETGRKFDGVERVRLAARIDLDLAIKTMLEQTINYLEKKGSYIAPITFTAYEKYKNLCKGQKYGTDQKDEPH